MTDIQAQLADGTILSFPEGTSDEVINRVVKQQTLAAKATALKPTLDAQAAKYPSPGPQGVDDSHPTVNNFMTNLWGSVDRNFAAPIRNPIDTLSGLAGQFVEGLTPTGIADQLTAGPLRRMLTPAATQAAKGDFSGAAGDLSGIGLSFMIPGAASTAAKTISPMATGAAARALPPSTRLAELARAAKEYKASPSAQPLPAAERADMPRSVNLARQASRVMKRGVASGAENVLNKAAEFKAGTEPPVMPQGPGRGIPTYDPYAPTPTRSLPTPGELETGVPQKSLPIAPPQPKTPQMQVKNIEQGIAPSGTAAKASTLRNTPRLQKLAPELGEIPPGPQFDGALVEGFRKVEAGVDAAEAAVPRSTSVPKTPIVEQWKGIAQDYLSNGDVRSAALVQKLVDTWSTFPEQIPWEQFVKTKRGFFGNGSRSPALRKAYQPLMDESSKISTTLAEANGNYSIFRRALDDAKIDTVTGRRIMQVGKPTK